MRQIARLRISTYARQHRSALLELCESSQWTHQHLDWYGLAQWLDQQRGQVFLAWQDEVLVGCIGLSLPLDGCAWIRVLSIRDGRMPGRTIDALWEGAEQHCRGWQTRTVAGLMVTNWLASYLRANGFTYADDVISMSHIGCRLPAPAPSSARLRSAEPPDLPQMARVDKLAFAPVWRLSEPELWQALRLNIQARLAMIDSQIVAYQLSTRYDGTAHLARLAVDPRHQGKGVGALLLHDFLSACQRWQPETISVNTQLSNLPSQRLYQRFGFFRSNFDMALWQKRIA